MRRQKLVNSNVSRKLEGKTRTTDKETNISVAECLMSRWSVHCLSKLDGYSTYQSPGIHYKSYYYYFSFSYAKSTFIFPNYSYLFYPFILLHISFFLSCFLAKKLCLTTIYETHKWHAKNTSTLDYLSAEIP